jgi:APA family basic amino acid/polyamine antiporter
LRDILRDDKIPSKFLLLDLSVTQQNKMGFWAVTSLVAGCQIGTGIFLLPANMAPFGAAGLCSWLITATGAMLLALIFAGLCRQIPRTGGPHAFIETAFGKTLGFFSAWTYWVISWLSTPMVVISVVSYLTPVTGSLSSLTNLSLQVVIVLLVTAINLRGVRSAGRVELVFTILKLLPLVLVPFGGLFFFKSSHFVPFNPTSESTFHVLNAAALLTLWGFIGVESATAPADAVDNPRKTIPRAIIMGTLIVAIVYIFSSVMITGVVPQDVLAQSKAPFADAAQIIFGGNWYLVISIAASIVCFGTLNAWVLTSGQIALGAASDGYLPRLFMAKNKNDAPKWGLLVSSLGMIPVLALTVSKDFISQVNLIVDLSVTAFLFIYTLSVLSYLKLFLRSEKGANIKAIILGVAALSFCGWALYSAGLKMVVMATLISLSGVPVYLFKKIKKSRQSEVISQ